MPTPNAQPHPTEPAADGPSLRVRRLRDRQSDDPGVLDAILAEAHVAHVGIVRGGHPVVLPFLCAVGDLGDGPVMLLHGSTGGGLFLDAGAEWRQAGCSMCLGMNPDQLSVGERCASPDLEQEHDLDGTPALVAVRRQAAG